MTAHALVATDVEQVVADSLYGTPGAKLARPMQSMCGDISAMVPRIQAPVLIVAGEFDRVDPPAQVKAEVLARILTASLHELPGHRPSFEVEIDAYAAAMANAEPRSPERFRAMSRTMIF